MSHDPTQLKIQFAIKALKSARDLLVGAGALKAAGAVRRAIKSADGARRHHELAAFRKEGRQRRAENAARKRVGAYPWKDMP